SRSTSGPIRPHSVPVRSSESVETAPKQRVPIPPTGRVGGAYLFLFSSSRTSSIVMGFRSPVQPTALSSFGVPPSLSKRSWERPRFQKGRSPAYSRVAAPLSLSRAAETSWLFTGMARFTLTISYFPVVAAFLSSRRKFPVHADLVPP